MDLVREARLIEQGKREAYAEIAKELAQARTTCREELGAEHNFRRCDAPAEFILWGKLIPPKGLGPRCYDHAAKHIDHDGLRPNSNYALLDLRPFLRALERAER
jgi:hypothetical protein